jgi:hypothetical protein
VVLYEGIKVMQELIGNFKNYEKTTFNSCLPKPLRLHKR